MKEIIIHREDYYIKPRMKKCRFRKNAKVYDLIKKSKGEQWIDFSYGNGGGNLIPFNKEDIIYSFSSFAEAEEFKNELEYGKTN